MATSSDAANISETPCSDVLVWQCRLVKTDRTSGEQCRQHYIKEVFDCFPWPRIEVLPMPKPEVVRAPVPAITLIEQCPSEKFRTFILAHMREGNAVMFSKTRNGKSVIVTCFTNDGKQREFCEQLEELYDALGEVPGPF